MEMSGNTDNIPLEQNWESRKRPYVYKEILVAFHIWSSQYMELGKSPPIREKKKKKSLIPTSHHTPKKIPFKPKELNMKKIQTKYMKV